VGMCEITTKKVKAPECFQLASIKITKRQIIQKKIEKKSKNSETCITFNLNAK
jgi:hypothetical protein